MKLGECARGSLVRMRRHRILWLVGNKTPGGNRQVRHPPVTGRWISVDRDEPVELVGYVGKPVQ